MMGKPPMPANKSMTCVIFFFGIICKNKHFSRNLSNDSDKKRRPSHFSQQRLSPNLHPAKSKPFLAQVLQRGADMIDGVVDAVCSKMELTGFPFRLGDSGSSPL